MGHVQDNAAESVRRVLDRLHDAEFTYPMDQGCEIRVSITVDKAKREATVDFTGTSPQRGDNFNAPAPVTRAAVLYVFRVMVEDDIPMNAGCLRPIRHRHSRGLDAVARNIRRRSSPAMWRRQPGRDELPVRRARGDGGGAGHDEQPHLRQRRSYQYYETICSGAPAGPGFDGAPGVHVHMTNSRLTDPEVLEYRFPVRAGGFPHPPRLRRQGPVERRRRHQPHDPVPRDDGMRHALRPPPRRAVRHRGRRARRAGPQPACGGWTGASSELAGCDQTVLKAGEAVTVITPTGGGFGDKAMRGSINRLRWLRRLSTNLSRRTAVRTGPSRAGRSAARARPSRARRRSRSFRPEGWASIIGFPRATEG